MNRMKRKQVYIQTDQDRRLRALARRKGKTESQLIREGIDRVLTGPLEPQLDHTAWQEALAFMDHLASLGPVPGGRTWKREDLYEERLRRRR